MKSAKLLLILILIIGMLTISLVACDWQENNSLLEGTPQPAWNKEQALRATYGAEMLQIQLTAIAENAMAGSQPATP